MPSGTKAPASGRKPRRNGAGVTGKEIAASLRVEAKRLRAEADRLDAIAADLAPGKVRS